MEAILVPVDFSATSMNAAAYALSYAKHTGEKIVLLHAYEPPVMFPVFQGAEISPDGLLQINKKELKLLAAQLTEKEPLIKVEYLLFEGKLTEVIIKVLETTSFSLVIMGLTGKSKLEKKIIGSNTLNVSKQLNVPVLLIPENAVYNPISDIGLTTDFKQVDTNIPEKLVKKIVEQTKAKLHILNVDFNNVQRNNDTPFQSGLIEMMFHQYHPIYHFIDNPDMADGLNEYAEKFSIELLIVIPHKHKLLEKIFAANHTKELLVGSEIPVIVMPS